MRPSTTTEKIVLERGQVDLFSGQVTAPPQASKFSPRLDAALNEMLPEPPATWPEAIRQALFDRLIQGELLDDMSQSLASYTSARTADKIAYWRRLATDKDYAEALFSDLVWVSEKGALLRACLTQASIATDSFVDRILCGFSEEWNYFVAMQDGALFAESSNAEH